VPERDDCITHITGQLLLDAVDHCLIHVIKHDTATGRTNDTAGKIPGTYERVKRALAHIRLCTNPSPQALAACATPPNPDLQLMQLMGTLSKAKPQQNPHNAATADAVLFTMPSTHSEL
jgi:hypothetical protein